MPSKPGELARLVAARGVRDERVLAAVRAVPREAFARTPSASALGGRRTGSHAGRRSSAPASCLCTGATGSGSEGA
jgi:protein-L-isoaspartate O-methyltransferase